MVSETVKSKVVAIATILLILAVFFSLPKILIGYVTLDQVPDLTGEWNANMVMTSCSNCRGSIGFSPFTMFISQSDDKATATAETIKQNDGSILNNFKNEVVFTGAKSLAGSYSLEDTATGRGTVNGTTRWIISDDCNSAKADADFTAYKGSRVDATGTISITVTRKNPTGCGLKCIEDWECSDWSACTDGTQTRLCFDNAGCKNESSRPSQSQECEMPVVPAPIPEKQANYTLMIMIIAIVALAGGVVYLSIAISKGKKRIVSNFEAIIGKMNEDLAKADRESLMNDYKIFSQFFEKYKDKIKELDSKRFYSEGIRIYGEMSKL